MTKIIAISNPKGGVGKTTTAINLAASLAVAEKKVLIIDIDPDGAVASGLGLKRAKIKAGVYEIFDNKIDITDAIHETKVPNLFVIPCNLWTPDQETQFSELAKKRSTLKDSINKIINNDTSAFDFIIIDTPPAINDLTIGALMTASSVLIPLQCGHFALKAIGRLMRIIRDLRNSENPGLKIEGIMLNFFEKRTKASYLTVKQAQLVFKKFIFSTIIPKNAAIGYSAFTEKPIVLTDATSSGCKAYFSLAAEIVGNSK